MRSLNKSAVVALALTAAIVGTAVAQDQSTQQGTSPGWTWSLRGMMAGFMGPGMMGFGGICPWMIGGTGAAEAICGAMGSHIEGRLAYVKAELKVTDAQESLWNAYQRHLFLTGQTPPFLLEPMFAGQANAKL